MDYAGTFYFLQAFAQVTMETFDTLIVGGGPAGLTAALYLARFRRHVFIADNRKSRAALIPQSNNYPGFANGISGPDLLARLRAQCEDFGAFTASERITHIQKNEDGFTARLENGVVVEALSVVMATGIVDRKPALPHMPEFIYEGAIRFCPICDGYEAMNKKIGVLGLINNIVKKALFLRAYSSDISLLPLDATITLTEDQTQNLQEAGIALPRESIADLIGAGEKISVLWRSGGETVFDVIYPVMGAEVRTELAIALGARCNEDGYLHTNDQLQTSVLSLYAVGDVTTDLHQISVATGQAAIAACAIHNSLPKNYI